MNTLHTIFKIFLFSYCMFSIRTEHSNSTSNIDYENVVHCKTHIRVHNVKYIWTIHNFTAHERLGYDILAPKLRALTTDKVEWDLRLHISYYYDVEYLSLHLFLSQDSVVPLVEAECNISIINNKDEVLFHKHIESKQYKKNWSSEQQPICKKDYCFRNHLLQNDTLTMVIYLKWYFEPSYHVFHQRKALSTSPTPTPEYTTTNKGGSNVFLKLCKNLHQKIF